MAPGVVQQLMISILVLTLPRLSSSCQTRDTPLLLSPYMDSSQVDTARNLSKVERGCVEDFVPDSFTGFLTVDKELGNHLFFWFFPSTEDENAPLLLWLNGGPTVSSMVGLFYENGPMQLIPASVTKTASQCDGSQEETTDSGYRKRKYSWAEPFSMLYVDSPVATGFSFSDSGERGQRGTQEGYTKDLVAFMKEFMKLFPEYKTRELYLGGQSYAGKYIPSLAHEIHTLIQAGQVDFNLTGIYLGAPWFDPEIQDEAFFDYLYNMGVISWKSLQMAKTKSRNFFAEARAGQRNISVFEYISSNQFYFELAKSKQNYAMHNSFSHDDFFALMSNSKIKRAAHIGDMEFTPFSMTSSAIMKLENDLMFVSTKLLLAELMDFYKVLIYNGDFDGIITTNMIDKALFTTPWKFQAEYKDEVRSTWRRDGREVIGYYSLTDRFCRVVIHGAGHQAPHDTPEVALTMMKQFIKHGCVRDYNESPDRYRMPSSVASTFHPCAIALLVTGFIWTRVFLHILRFQDI